MSTVSDTLPQSRRVVGSAGQQETDSYTRLTILVTRISLSYLNGSAIHDRLS